MKIETKKSFCVAAIMFIAFILWTVLLRFVDVKPIGPNESYVGFATINNCFHKLTGVNLTLYTITDWLSLVPVFICLGFGVIGIIQWIERKSIFKIDYNILVLGFFYIAVMATYLFFEKCVINYRPVLINDYLEASYPSSTTLLVLCVMPTAIMQFNASIKNVVIKRCVIITITVFVAFMVIGRIISGVHWISDIIGGALLSAGFVMMYKFIISLKIKNR